MFPGKQFFKAGVEKFLQKLVRYKLRRTRPTVIGITGSFGKTTTKDAVATILKTRYRVLQSKKSMNTEIGLLLAVLEQPSGFSSPFRWLAILTRAAVNAFFGSRCDFWVLEYGADKPGDIGALVSVVQPDVAIITRIARMHQAQGQFKNIDEVFAEKWKLALAVPKNGTVILNADDEKLAVATAVQKNALLNSEPREAGRARGGGSKSGFAGLEGATRAPTKKKTLWFSENGKMMSDMFASDGKNTAIGFSATLHHGKDKISASFSVAGSFHLSAFLPALLCASLFDISVEKGIRALQKFTLPPGRMSLIPGKHDSLLIDSSYNASPETLKQALRLLHELPGTRKIAVIGNMNELGTYTKEAHREVGKLIGEWLNLLITVGDAAAETAHAALKNGLSKTRIETLRTAEEAAHFLLKKGGLKKGDIVLLKGSQNNVRLERAVKLLMACPEDAPKLLCRQEKDWNEKL